MYNTVEDQIARINAEKRSGLSRVEPKRGIKFHGIM